MTSPYKRLSDTSYALLTAKEHEDKKYREFISTVQSVEGQLSDIDVIAAALKENPRLGSVRSAIEMTLLRTAVDDETATSLRSELKEDTCELLEELAARFAHAEVLAMPDVTNGNPLPAPPLLGIRDSFWRRIVRPSFLKILILSIPLMIIVNYLLQVKAESIVYKGSLMRTAVGEKRHNLASLLFFVSWPIKSPEKTMPSMLEKAVRNDDLPMVELLLNNGAKVELSPYSALATACEQKKPALIGTLLSHCKNKNDTEASFSFLKGTRRFMTTEVLAALRKNGLKVYDSYWTNFVQELPLNVLLELLHEGREHSGLAPLSDKEAKVELILGLAKHGSLETVQKAIELGASHDARDKIGNTLLHMASHNFREPLIRYLLSFIPTAISAKNDLGQSPLHIACLNERPSIVRLLLERGADVNAQAKKGATPLLTIAGKRGADGLYTHGLEVVKILCDNGADLELRDSWQDTAFSEACQTGNLLIAKELIKRGAKQDIRDKDGDTPLIGALRSGYSRVALYLIKEAKHDIHKANNEGATALLFAFRTGHSNVYRELLKRGANTKVVTKSGNTALHFIAQGDSNVEIIDEFIKNGSSIDCQNKMGRTPLHYSLNDYSLCYISLLAKGASLTIRDNNGDGPLHFVSSDGMIPALTNRGLDINEKNKLGQTPLMSALRRGCTWLIMDFLKNGAKVNEVDVDGRTALHWLAALKSEDAVRTRKNIALLNFKGAHLDVADKAGYTPLLIACKHGSLATVRHLHSLGAKLTNKTNDGKSTFDLAAESKEKELIRWLNYQMSK